MAEGDQIDLVRRNADPVPSCEEAGLLDRLPVPHDGLLLGVWRLHAQDAHDKVAPNRSNGSL